MCSPGKSHFFHFLIHQFHKCFFGACHIFGKCNCRLCTGWQDRSVKQISDRHLFIQLKPCIAAVIGIAVVRILYCDRHFVIQSAFIDLLCCHKHRQDLCHGSRIDDRLGIPLLQDRFISHIYQNSIAADDFRGHICCFRCCLCAVDNARFRILRCLCVCRLYVSRCYRTVIRTGDHIFSARRIRSFLHPDLRAIICRLSGLRLLCPGCFWLMQRDRDPDCHDQNEKSRHSDPAGFPDPHLLLFFPPHFLTSFLTLQLSFFFCFPICL